MEGRRDNHANSFLGNGNRVGGLRPPAGATHSSAERSRPQTAAVPVVFARNDGPAPPSYRYLTRSAYGFELP
jgi:hypothetical protein